MQQALLLLSGVVLAIVHPPQAAADWPEELAAEILMVEDCVVAFLSNVEEREIDGRQTVMAKVHCEDQRVFDAWREDPLLAFQFNDCTEAVETC
ncbi:hypothetical protein [Marinimicrococcus flavescens]|uniref:Uncharacterized protein n=1 Tax=Marinimicrococcus flavescens TaxID=3031815 RepID=A0AAP3XRJ9_9PROT|nr:hypothetical protein [Marinimicrococcus flavescens]